MKQLILKAARKEGAVKTVTQMNSGENAKVVAESGARYHVVDEHGKPIPGLKFTRKGKDLYIDDEAFNRHLVIEDYFDGERCTGISACQDPDSPDAATACDGMYYSTAADADGSLCEIGDELAAAESAIEGNPPAAGPFAFLPLALLGAGGAAGVGAIALSNKGSGASAGSAADTTAPAAPTAPTVAENAGGGINAVEAADGTVVAVSLAGTNAVAGDKVTVTIDGTAEQTIVFRNDALATYTDADAMLAAGRLWWCSDLISRRGAEAQGKTAWLCKKTRSAQKSWQQRFSSIGS